MDRCLLNSSNSELVIKLREDFIPLRQFKQEAAAVTEAAAAGCGAPMEDPVVLQLDSPFVYGVIDVETGLPLFIGFLEDPSAE